MTSPSRPVPRLAGAARGLLTEPDLQKTLRRSVELAAAHFPGAHSASVTLVSRRREVTTPASTHEWAALADRWQYDGDEGPCLDAIRVQEVVVVDDVAGDGARRYPRWAPRVAQGTGLRSSLSCRLFTEREQLGSVNVYAERPGAFDDADVDEVQVLAAQVALALSAARQLEGLRVGMEGRTVIGQAQGILMERYKVSADAAFQVLSRTSQDTNVRLRDVAVRLVATGETPGDPRA
jgi:GAF domain-containing protein